MKNAKAIYYQSIEPSILKEAEARQKRILDADYSAIDLESYTHELKHLVTNKQQNQLLDTLKRFPKTFRGGLGVLKVPPVHLELRIMENMRNPIMLDHFLSLYARRNLLRKKSLNYVNKEYELSAMTQNGQHLHLYNLRRQETLES